MKAQQVMLVLDHLINAVANGKELSHEKLAAMNRLYNLSGTGNVEIGFRHACHHPAALQFEKLNL